MFRLVNANACGFEWGFAGVRVRVASFDLVLVGGKSVVVVNKRLRDPSADGFRARKPNGLQFLSNEVAHFTPLASLLLCNFLL